MLKVKMELESLDSLLGPVVQSIIRLTSLLVVKLLMYQYAQYQIHRYFGWKDVSSFCIYFFSKNITIYAIFNDQSFNDMLTNDNLSIEQLGPEVKFLQHFDPFTWFNTWFFFSCCTPCWYRQKEKKLKKSETKDCKI